MRKFLLAALIVLTSIAANGQDKPAKIEIVDFPATVIAIDSNNNIATITSTNTAHVFQVDATGAVDKWGVLELNKEYYFILDQKNMDCDSCRVKTQVLAVAYFITQRQTAKEIAEMIRFNIPRKNSK